MRIFIFFLMLIVVCLFQFCSSTGSVEKPKNLIDENLMEKVLYEITIMDAMRTFSPKNQVFQKIYGKTFIYLKYGVDSLQLAESNNYYAKFPRVYSRMYSNILVRMKRTKDSLDLMGKTTK